MTRVARAALGTGAARVLALRSRVSLRERERRRQTLQHTSGLRRPRARGVVVADKTPSALDAEIAARLLAAYRAASRDLSVERSDVWTDIAQRQRRFTSILSRGDVEELARYLCNVSRHDASAGITQGADEFRRITRDRSYRRFVTLLAKDKLVSLAEAVGALAIENPEQGAYGSNLYCDAGELVCRISERIGIAISPPGIDGGLLKLDTGRGLFGERDANAIYTAWLLTRLLARSQGRRVCEIGGGSGRVAYWSNRLGITSYTVVDLPQTNVVQGYYALKNLPGDQVSLYGEQQPGDRRDRLEILPAHAISTIRETTYDLVLNQDSFPEINRETVADYLRWTRRSCRGRFLSINHESKPSDGRGGRQLSVPETIREVGGFTLENRWPYWLRRGYATELYRLDPSRRP